MADERNVKYWVEVALKDDRLKEQLKGWNWKEIMGLDDLGDVFSKEGNEAVAAFNKAIASTDIDWEKVLGSKKFKSAIYGIVKDSNKQLREGFFTKQEAAKITEFIGAVSEAMGQVGTSLDTDGLVRSLKAFGNMIAPIRAEIEALADAPEKVKMAFDKVFGDRGIDLTPTINTKGIVDSATKTIEGVGDVVVRRVHEVSKEVQKENNRATKLLTDLNRSNVDTSRLTDITSITKKLGSLYSSYEANLARATKAGDDDAARFAKDIFDTIAYAEKEFETFSHERIFSKSQLQDIQRFFNEHISVAKRAQEDYRKEVEKAFQLDLADRLTENLKSLNLKIALPKQSDFTKQINKLIVDVNKKRLEKIKTTIDISSELNPKTKKEREALDKKEISAIEKKFAAIDDAIDVQQQSILEKTRTWRKHMQDAIEQGGANSVSFGFKWDSADVDQIASDIFENLQEFFAQEDHKIAIRIDEEALLNGIKGVLGDKTIAIGGSGGNVNIDPTSIAEAVKVGIRSAILGEPITASETPKYSNKQSESNSQRDDNQNAPKHKIDINKTYTTHLIDTLQDIAKSAIKEKDGNLNQKQKDVIGFFSSKGINLRDLGDTDEDVAKLLEQALLSTDEQGKIRGSDLIDAIKNFQTRSKVHWKSLDELTRAVRILLTSFGEEAEYEDAKLVDNQSAEIIKDASKKAKGARKLRGIKNYYNRSNTQYNDRNLPTEENIDQIIKLSSEMETDGLLAEQLTILKEARQKLGDKTDDQSVAEFQTVYQEVWSKIEKRFYDLVNYLQAFSGELDVEGRKTPVKFSNRTGKDKSRIVGTLANLKEDVVIKHAEIYTSPNDQSIGMGIKSPKTGRASQGQERALLKGSNTSFTVRENRDDELAVRNRTYSAIDNAATSYFSRGDTLQRLGLSTNDVGKSDKTVEDYNKLIATEEERLKAATEASALSEQFRQDVKKILGKPTEYSTPTLDKKAIQSYYDELEEQQKKLAENQLQQEKINQALADNAKWLEKVWPQEMEAARQSGDTTKQQALLSRRDAVLAGETRSIEQKHVLRAEESAIKNRIQTLTASVTEGIQKPISNVIAQTLAQLQRLGVEHQGVTQGTPEEYAIVGKAQDLLHVLQSAEQDAIQRLEQFGINVDSLLTQEQKEIIELATETFITSQQDVKKNIRRNVVDRPTGGTYAIESGIDKLKSERDELIQKQQAEHLRNLVENSKLSGEVLEGLQAESEIRRKKYDALGQADQVQSNLSLAYSKRSDASSRINYAEEQKGKLDRFGLSARGTYANDVLEERKKFYANEFFSSDWYYNEVQRIRSETTEEMQAVEKKIVEKHKKWKQVVDKTKQEVIKEVASESVDLEQIRTGAEEEFTKSKKYKNIIKSQDRKKQSKLAEIQTKIDAEVAEMVESAMVYQTEAIEAEARDIAKNAGRNTATKVDIEKATSRVRANVETLSRERVNTKYANDIELVDSEMRMYLENAVVQAGERAVQQAIQDVIKGKSKEVGRRIYEAINAREEKLRANSKFQGMTGSLLTDYDKAQQGVYDKRKKSVKELSRSYYDNLISEDGVLSIPQSQNEDGTWVVTTEDVRAIVDARLDTILKDAKDDKASAQENVDKYSSIKSNIISENGLTDEEVYNRKLAQAMLLEQERQVQYKEDIELLNKVLEDEGLGDEQKKIVKAKIRELETNLQDSVLTEEALQTRRDAVWSQRKTGDVTNNEKIAKNEERIASYNESIEKSQNKQTQLRAQIAELAEKAGTATDEEKKALEEQQATLQSRLENEKKVEESLRRDRVRRKKENERLKETPVETADSQKKDNSVVSVFANAIKQAVKEAIGKGGIGDASGIATENTLKEILAILTGGKVVYDPKMDKKLARIAELEAKSKVVVDQKPTEKPAQKKERKKKEATPDYIEQANKYAKETLSTIASQEELAKIAKNLVSNIEQATQGSKKAVELQLKLQKVISASGKLYKTSTGEKKYTNAKIGEILGIGDKYNLKLTGDEAKKIAEQGFVDASRKAPQSSQNQSDLLIVSNTTNAFKALRDAIVLCTNGFDGLNRKLINHDTLDPQTTNIEMQTDAAQRLLDAAKQLSLVDMPLSNAEGMSMQQLLTEVYRYFEMVNNREVVPREMAFSMDAIAKTVAEKFGVQWGTYAQGNSAYDSSGADFWHSHPDASLFSMPDLDLGANGLGDTSSLGLLMPDFSYIKMSGLQKLNEEQLQEVYEALDHDGTFELSQTFGESFVQAAEFPKIQQRLAALGVDIQKYTFDSAGNVSEWVSTISQETLELYEQHKMFESMGDIGSATELEDRIMAHPDYVKLHKNDQARFRDYMRLDELSAMQTMSDAHLDLTRMLDPLRELVGSMAQTEAVKIINEFFASLDQGLVNSDLINTPEMRHAVQHILGYSHNATMDSRAKNILHSYGYAEDPMKPGEFLDVSDNTPIWDKHYNAGFSAMGDSDDVKALIEKIAVEYATLSKEQFKQKYDSLLSEFFYSSPDKDNYDPFGDVIKGGENGGIMEEFIKKVSLLYDVPYVGNLANNTAFPASEDRAKAKERELKAEEKITKEKQKQKVTTSGLSKAEQEELARLKEEVKPKVVASNETTSGGLGSLAREDTLSKILEVLNAFKNDGVKVTGKKQSEAKAKEPKVEKTEAELIRDRATSQKDAVLASAAGKGSLFKKFNQNLKDLDDAVAEANKASETEKAKAIANVKAKAQKVSALSYNILKNTSEWDYIVAQSDSGAQDLKLKKGQSPRDKMERMAKMEAGVLGRNGKELKNPKNQYKFLGFDGETLTYQLTDIEGQTRKVTMVWNEFTNQVAITSDKSVAKLDTLAEKVKTFDDKFKNAVQMGYLTEDDGSYKEFLDKVANIDAQSTFEDIEKARNEALQAADKVTKKIAQNKKLYTGTVEMNAADRQYGKLESSRVLDQTDLELVERYKTKYNEIVAIQTKWKALDGGKGLLREDAQKELRKTALEAQSLGKELEKAASNSERLEEAMRNSGTFNGQKIGAEFKVADDISVYDQMVAKLKELGAEHIKVDRVRKIATGTVRHNNTTVSDLTVEYDKLRGSLARYQKQERESLTGLPAFINGFQKKFNSIMQYLTMTMSIHQVLAQLRQGVQYIKEIDLALVELRKVTNETEAEYDKFLQTAAKTGERLGSTISAVTEATATFAKLGYSIGQATEMAEAAIVYKNVGDNIASTEDAADSIISTMKGFGLEASESMQIVDRFNEVGKLDCPCCIVIYN